jgi:hypothetical protein
MSDWDGIPADLHPDDADVVILSAITWNVIEAQAIHRDFEYAKNLAAGQRQLRHSWESRYAREPERLLGLHFLPLLHQTVGSSIHPVAETIWNARIDQLARVSRLMAQRIKSPGLKAFMLYQINFLKHDDGTLYRKMDFLFTHSYVDERNRLLRLQRPDRLAGWFVSTRPDRVIRYLRGERPYHDAGRFGDYSDTTGRKINFHPWPWLP